MKNVLMVAVLVVVGLSLGMSNAHAADMNVWWDHASAQGAVVSNTDGSWLDGPANYDVEYLGLCLNGPKDTLFFALQTTFDLVSVPSDPSYPYIHNGDFVFDLNDDGALDSALDFSISGNDVTYDLYQLPNLVWENGVFHSDYDPIGVLAAASTKVASFTVLDAFDTQDGSFLLEGCLTAGAAGCSAFDLGSYSVQWAMSCGNDGDKVTVVPEPASLLLLATGFLGMLYFFRKK